MNLRLSTKLVNTETISPTSVEEVLFLLGGYFEVHYTASPPAGTDIVQLLDPYICGCLKQSYSFPTKNTRLIVPLCTRERLLLAIEKSTFLPLMSK